MMGKSMDEEGIEELISTLPMGKGWIFENSYKYQGCWFDKPLLKGVIHAQKNFQLEPNTNTMVLATYPKCGTTWFSALLLLTVNRNRHNVLSRHSPLFLGQKPENYMGWLESSYHPRYILDGPPKLVPSLIPLFKTHIPYTLLPETIIESENCSIIYVCRDPMDVFVSYLHFSDDLKSMRKLPLLDKDEAFDMFCRGTALYGSYWDNVLGYWKKSQEMPNKVLFLRYEDMKENPIDVMKKLASFVGFPFTQQEEQGGVIEKIVEICNFDSLKSFQATNRDGGINSDSNKGIFKSLFRKGVVGDHKNSLSEEMIQRLKEITDTMFSETGLDVYA